jgi:hypothetical protein
MGKILPRLWILLLLAPLLYLAPLLADPAQVHASPGSEYSDLIVAHWPSAEFLRQSLLRYGEIPFWNPHTLGGTPFAADPLSGLYYPPLWLALLIPAPLAFNILFFLHMAFAGIGAYRLARAEIGGQAGWAGQAGPLLAGIAFGGMPKLAAHVAAGHLTLVLAVSWTPWLLLAARAAARNRSVRRWALAGVLAGVVFLADPRWLIPSALAAAGYALLSGGDCGPQPRRKLVLSWIPHLAVFGLFAAAVAAVLALPMGQFVSLSTRADLSGAEGSVLSLPFDSLLGFFFGGIAGSIEWVIYPGAVVLGLVLASLFPIHLSKHKLGEVERGDEGENRRSDAFWWVLFFLSVLLSLGSNIPGLMQLVGAVPGMGLLRVPPRWMFLAGLALAMLAARGLGRLETAADERGILKKAGFALAAGGLTLAVAGGILGLPAALWQDGLIWGGLGAILFVGFLPKSWSLPAGSALVCLAVIDLAIADGRMIDPNPADPISAGVGEISALLAKDAGEARVYSPSASIPLLAAVRYGLRSLDGIDPLILRSTAEVVSQAARVPPTGYSVTLPEFAAGNPRIDNRNIVPDWQRMALLNVRYIVAAYSIPSQMLFGCRPHQGIYLCADPFTMPRAWVAGGIGTWDQPSAGHAARIESESPNRVRLTADGPGIVVLADAYYPAWRATVDGEPAKLMEVGGWWRAVEIGTGEHVVVMSYDPSLSGIGLGITLLALLALLGVWRWAK